MLDDELQGELVEALEDRVMAAVWRWRELVAGDPRLSDADRASLDRVGGAAVTAVAQSLWPLYPR